MTDVNINAEVIEFKSKTENAGAERKITTLGGRVLTPIEERFVEENIKFYEEGLSVSEMFELAYVIQKESKLRKDEHPVVNIYEKSKIK